MGPLAIHGTQLVPARIPVRSARDAGDCQKTRSTLRCGFSRVFRPQWASLDRSLSRCLPKLDWARTLPACEQKHLRGATLFDPVATEGRVECGIHFDWRKYPRV